MLETLINSFSSRVLHAWELCRQVFYVWEDKNSIPKNEQVLIIFLLNFMRNCIEEIKFSEERMRNKKRKIGLQSNACLFQRPDEYYSTLDRYFHFSLYFTREIQLKIEWEKIPFSFEPYLTDDLSQLLGEVKNPGELLNQINQSITKSVGAELLKVIVSLLRKLFLDFKNKLPKSIKLKPSEALKKASGGARITNFIDLFKEPRFEEKNTLSSRISSLFDNFYGYRQGGLEPEEQLSLNPFLHRAKVVATLPISRKTNAYKIIFRLVEKSFCPNREYDPAYIELLRVNSSKAELAKKIINELAEFAENNKRTDDAKILKKLASLSPHDRGQRLQK